MSEELIPGYFIRRGSTLDRALLVQFMEQTYQDICPQQDFSHLRQTVEQYLLPPALLWWVDITETVPNLPFKFGTTTPVACLWMGNAIDQVTGLRHAHIFLLYVVPQHRQKGIGTALMKYAENWAKKRGDSQIALQVFTANQPALKLYNYLGYQTQSLWMIKSLQIEEN
ncbi:MAG: GNAT family N-acetyltransferase [Cyanobacteria bacterium P01_A01_bin.84]